MSQPVTIKRLINAPSEKIFAAWSKPEMMQQWFFPAEPGWKAQASNEFKVGGQYKEVMISEDGTIYNHTGIYKEIIPNKKIVFTWNSDAIKDTLVTLEFHEKNGQTELTLIHEFFPNEEQRSNHNEGWNECLQNLTNFLAR